MKTYLIGNRKKVPDSFEKWYMTSQIFFEYKPLHYSNQKTQTMMTHNMTVGEHSRTSVYRKRKLLPCARAADLRICDVISGRALPG